MKKETIKKNIIKPRSQKHETNKKNTKKIQKMR